MDADPIELVRALLTRAEAAHGEYESRELNGVYDEDWPRWYAGYVVEQGLGKALRHPVSPDQVAEFLASSNEDYRRLGPAPAGPWAAYTARRLVSEL